MPNLTLLQLRVLQATPGDADGTTTNEITKRSGIPYTAGTILNRLHKLGLTQRVGYAESGPGQRAILWTRTPLGTQHLHNSAAAPQEEPPGAA